MQRQSSAGNLPGGREGSSPSRASTGHMRGRDAPTAAGTAALLGAVHHQPLANGRHPRFTEHPSAHFTRNSFRRTINQHQKFI